MVPAELVEEIVLGEQQVVETDAGAHEYLLDARQAAQFTQQLDVVAMVGHEHLARLRREARLAAAGAALELAVA